MFAGFPSHRRLRRASRWDGYGPHMVKQGPIPAFLHGLYEYLGGIALIALPLLVPYHSDPATAVSIVLGVLLLFLTATTSSSTSLINQIPLAVHILLDYALAAVLIASPFLFSFSNKATPTPIFIGAGVLHLLISIGTRYRKEGSTRGESGRRQGDQEGSAIETPPSASRERPARGTLPDDEIPEFEPPPRSP